jgi:peptide/nickel transport system ATP-binding protein/oligopeptide transport system ATP-binding protein
MIKPVLTVENLSVTFETKYGSALAVNDISFTLKKGEKLGLVGESGSGKSVTSKSIIRLLQSPPAKVEGKIFLGDNNLLEISEKEMRSYRGNRVAMIFQEPMVCLNPLFTIGDQLSEVIRLHQKCPKKECYQKVVDMLNTVGIPSPEMRFKQYPFELSGGMRQRIMIAMALLCNPEVLIADEPTTALDVTIQAQIMDLLTKLNEDFDISIILITHDLGVVAEMVDTVAVMYAGSIVEKASVREIFDDPWHPYTQGLLKSIPTMKFVEGDLETIEGNVPSIYKLPRGCTFHNRCKNKKPICTQEVPPITMNAERCVKCWKYTDRWV